MNIVQEVIDLPSVIDTALKLNAASHYRKNLSMRIELAANVPSFLISDEMRLVQVLSNLLNNAIKFTEQGEISLLIDSIGLSDSNALIRFKVKDTGIGISKENQEHLFEAFSQADISMTRKYGGSGLGLSICQQIVKLLGGEITLKSDLGAGCEFTFILPFSLPDDVPKQQLGFHHITCNKIESIHIFSVNQPLSVSCIETIESFSWHYHPVGNVTELSKVLVKDVGANEQLQEITLLGDKSIPFSILKKVMSTCTELGYTKISLAVVQKSAASQS